MAVLPSYEATRASVRRHTVPPWFHDAKLGIFIHWGLYSVPAYAPVEDGELPQVLAKYGWKGFYRRTPYAEWYQNSLRIGGSPARQWHAEHYGEDASYEAFAPMFNDAIKNWAPDEWAALFARAGARYTVICAKHHDGFLLWPSTNPNPHRPDYYASRDILGEYKAAAEAQGIRFGLYYSGALDWTFSPRPIASFADMFAQAPPPKTYGPYVERHYRELIERYRPAVLWNDIGYPPGPKLAALFAHFYNTVPEGVINDRWSQLPAGTGIVMKAPPLSWLIAWVAKRMLLRGAVAPPAGVHCDYATPEYAVFGGIKTKKWECVRGVGYSFGYNQREEEAHYLGANELIRMFVDIVSKNGNLLLNVGPMADGTIPAPQVQRLEALGDWLARNGEAIYGTRPWHQAEGTTTGGTAVRYTATATGDRVNVVVYQDTQADLCHLTIKGFPGPVPRRAVLLDGAEEVTCRETPDGLRLDLPRVPPGPALAVQLHMGP
jgi:alpha-L-fucosidase